MVDASLGGKTGVDLPNGKNLVGAFYAPRYVLADPQVLSTLPELEMRSGLAEVVKSAVIGDVDLFDLCATGWENVLSNLGQIIQRSMAVKIKIIQDDPYEKRNRAILNYGHTVGHAIECLSKYSLPHGLCVAMGMVAETRLAVELNLAHSGLSETIKRVLNQLGLPNKIPASFLAEDVIAAMRSDKKKSEGSIRFSLPIKIGEVKSGFIIEDTQLLSSVLKECQE
jgi:3-dehydroquinate synthetase